ncbi:hypothetical protein PWG71_25445 [Nocardiopsis sp. N85]|uniref:hypothetical protein n=1 Tax=Nocardiopsis sp. N85 TaxID=3029400 RepID=UPI00237F5F40|nr:hypothetical protein [Nocardiopsis sp. N85]MDE3724745.1 hypothetical protein [Nocardiopsis sp. N85]
MYQTYDRDRLLRQVRELLREEGVRPINQTDPAPEHAAALLLRSFGVEPVLDHVEVLKRSMDRAWEDADDARTEKINNR